MKFFSPLDFGDFPGDSGQARNDELDKQRLIYAVVGILHQQFVRLDINICGGHQPLPEGTRMVTPSNRFFRL